MIHPMEAPVFGDLKPPVSTRRRYSWTATGEDEDPAIADSAVSAGGRGPVPSAELANVLWGGLFQTWSDRLLPHKTVGDAIEILAESVADGLSTKSQTPTEPSKRFSDGIKLTPLKLAEAHMTNKSADKICAGVGHHHHHHGHGESNHKASNIAPAKVLLLRRDETYDLELIFDRRVDQEHDQIAITMELDDHFIGIPGFNVATFPVTASLPDQFGKSNAEKQWWATYLNVEGKKSIIRFHVSNSARIGKWCMKILTGVKDGESSPKKRDRDSTIAFQRLHIAMCPDQMIQKAVVGFSTRRFSKQSFTSNEA